MGLGVTKVVSSIEIALADKDLDVAAGTVKETVAGQHWRWSGMRDGEEVIAHETVWRIHPDVAPEWESGNNWIRFKGRPEINFGAQDFAFMDDRMLATGMHAMNAIPYVVDAAPGIQTFLDLPWIFVQKWVRCRDGQLSTGNGFRRGNRRADLSGKTVVVTGGSAGLGVEAIRVLAKQGAKVVSVVRDTVKGKQRYLQFAMNNTTLTYR